jgi:receptor protein-tyrosine kinase
MGLIEEAAKRLEQLRNAGVDLGDGAAPAPRGLRDLDTRGRAKSAPEARVREVRSSERLQDPGFLAKPAPRSEPGAPLEGHPAQHSRRIVIDLARLAAAGMVTPDAPRSQIADEFRVIKRPLLGNASKRGGAGASPNMIMVTSALAGEGKTFTAVNLAMSIAMELDNTVLLVDADVANPTLPGVLRFSSPKGLLDVLTDRAIGLPDVLLRTNVQKLSILPAGTAHRRATELLASEAMERLITEIANRYPDRIVVFDAPPLLPTTESRVLASHMGQIVIVVEADKTTHSALKQALATIESCPLVMTMLNKAARSEVGSYYGYHGYGHGE